MQHPHLHKSARVASANRFSSIDMNLNIYTMPQTNPHNHRNTLLHSTPGFACGTRHRLCAAHELFQLQSACARSRHAVSSSEQQRCRRLASNPMLQPHCSCRCCCLTLPHAVMLTPFEPQLVAASLVWPLAAAPAHLAEMRSHVTGFRVS